MQDGSYLGDLDELSAGVVFREALTTVFLHGVSAD